MKFGLKDETYAAIVACLGQFPQIGEAILYGSRAMGNYHEASDIDLALKGNLSFRDIAHIQSELEELPTLYKFDVLHYDTLKHANLKDHIDRVGQVICSAQPIPSSPEEVSHVHQ